MFAANARRQLGDGSFQGTFVFERRFTMHLVDRTDLAYDTRFVPAPAARCDNAMLYLVLEGDIEILSAPPVKHRGPAAFKLNEDTFEGAAGRDVTAFRTRGHRFRSLEVRAAPSDLTSTEAGRVESVELTPATWEAAGALREAAGQGLGHLGPAVRALLGALAASGLASPELEASTSDEDPRFARIWSSVRPLAEKRSFLPSLDDLAGLSGLSLRQLARDIEGFVQTFRLPDRSWRETTRRLRLKTALLGLSASGLPISEVARAAGYGSVEAMARAFRDAKLPVPTVVRDAIRA
ncbi:MAG: hypothetical protein IPM79_34060 [Polyangiaceae bacterium]|jgi:AraC-like DNA-binding protein|nr:hypothetical protein [Polyangiaceae bacterium]MBK8942491.1 hypothetical protein [Polyangiaceae bacterium]